MFLLGLVIALGSYFGLFWLIVYVVYINQFQIKPEEEALLLKFKEDYQAYKQSVRRWL